MKAAILYVDRFAGKKKIEKKKLYSCSRFAHNLLHYDEDCRLRTKFAFYKTSYNDFHSALNYMKSPGSLFVLKDFENLFNLSNHFLQEIKIIPGDE